MRQGLLNVEAAWVTHTWWDKLVAKLFGVIAIDAMLPYNFEHSTTGFHREKTSRGGKSRVYTFFRGAIIR